MIIETSRRKRVKGVYYLGQKSDLTAVCYRNTAASIGGYGIFAGGTDGGTYYNYVDIYDSNLVQTTPNTLSVARAGISSTSVGEYALFAGGLISGGYSNVVDAFNFSLTKSTPTALSKERAMYSANSAATVGNYALFAGGYISGTPSMTNVVDAYNTALTRSVPTALSVARYATAGGSIGNYALFAGGLNTSTQRVNTIDAYDSSLVVSTATELSAISDSCSSATIPGKYVLFTEVGILSGGVNAFNTLLVRSSPANAHLYSRQGCGACIGNNAIFAGGNYAGTPKNNVTSYDSNLIKTTLENMPQNKDSFGAAVIGDTVLFGGGHYLKNAYYSKTVYAYTYGKLP